MRTLLAADTVRMLAWDGEATADKAAAHVPWVLASAAMAWEYTSCFLVDGYDGMTGYDFADQDGRRHGPPTSTDGMACDGCDAVP